MKPSRDMEMSATTVPRDDASELFMGVLPPVVRGAKQRAKAGSTSGDPSTRSAPWSAASAGGSPAWMIAARVLGSESIRGGRSREGGGESEDCGRRWIWKSPRWIQIGRASCRERGWDRGWESVVG